MIPARRARASTSCTAAGCASIGAEPRQPVLGLDRVQAVRLAVRHPVAHAVGAEVVEHPAPATAVLPRYDRPLGDVLLIAGDEVSQDALLALRGRLPVGPRPAGSLAHV